MSEDSKGWKRRKYYPEACGTLEERNDKSEGGRAVRRSVARFVSVRSTVPQSGAGGDSGAWGCGVINSRQRSVLFSALTKDAL